MPKKKIEQKTVISTRYSRPIVFNCRECGLRVKEIRWPGPLPKYCSDCAPVVRKRYLRDKQRERRARLKSSE